jgi:hypothetical protein
VPTENMVSAAPIEVTGVRGYLRHGAIGGRADVLESALGCDRCRRFLHDGSMDVARPGHLLHGVREISIPTRADPRFGAISPRWTGQNRPFVDTSKPAISGERIEASEFYRTLSPDCKSVWTFVRQLRGPHFSTCA